MKKVLKAHLYRVEIMTNRNKRLRYLAEVQAVLDEDARRKIIHQTMAENGRVLTIRTTEDRARYPGEKPKRNYGPA
jgi:hypothetical protein